MEITDVNTLFGAYPSHHADSDAQTLAAAMTAQQVDYCLAMSTYGLYARDTDGNAETLIACRAHDHLIPVATINPLTYWGQPGLVQEIAQSGFEIFRFFPRTQQWPLDFAPFAAILDILAALPRAPLMVEIDPARRYHADRPPDPGLSAPGDIGRSDAHNSRRGSYGPARPAKLLPRNTRPAKPRCPGLFEEHCGDRPRAVRVGRAGPVPGSGAGLCPPLAADRRMSRPLCWAAMPSRSGTKPSPRRHIAMPIFDAHSYYGETLFSSSMATPEAVRQSMALTGTDAVALISMLAADCDFVAGNRALRPALSPEQGVYGWATLNAGYADLSQEEQRRYLGKREFVGAVMFGGGRQAGYPGRCPRSAQCTPALYQADGAVCSRRRRRTRRHADRDRVPGDALSAARHGRR